MLTGPDEVLPCATLETAMETVQARLGRLGYDPETALDIALLAAAALARDVTAERAVELARAEVPALPANVIPFRTKAS